jgi:hypothetical protein
MGDVVRYGTDDNILDRGPSPAIWKDCPIQEFQEQPGKGSHMFDDFRNSLLKKEEAGRTALTGGIGELHGDMAWSIYSETALIADIALQADDEGVLMLDTDGTDDDVVGITGGDNVQGVWRSPKIGEEQRFWFEARVKVSTITDTDLSWFIGLMEPGKLGDGTPLGAVGALADVDYIGFHVAEADGDDLTLVYNEATSGTAQANTGSITLVADTYVRVGMKVVKLGNKVTYRFFADGVDLGDGVAVTLDGAANANWPGDTNMDIMVAVTSGALGEDGDNLKIDWIRMAQEF